MRMKKHSLTLGIIIIAIILLLPSCRLGLAAISDEEARQILGELIPKAEELNEVFLGVGLEPSDHEVGGMSSAAVYVVVSPDAKYQTVGELASAAESVFSVEYCTILFESAFYGSEDFTPRYTDSDDGKLQINVNDKGYTLRTKLFPERAAVKNEYDGKTAVSVPAEFDGKPCEDIIVYIVEENGRWLIDSPTY